MHKLILGSELYPVYLLKVDGKGRQVGVSDELAERYDRIVREWRNLQHELALLPSDPSVEDTHFHG